MYVYQDHKYFPNVNELTVAIKIIGIYQLLILSLN